MSSSKEEPSLALAGLWLSTSKVAIFWYCLVYYTTDLRKALHKWRLVLHQKQGKVYNEKPPCWGERALAGQDTADLTGFSDTCQV